MVVLRKRGGHGWSFGGSSASLSLRGLANAFADRLSEKFPHAVQSNFALGDSFADVVIEEGDRFVVAELKTGDPELPLPSSTAPQMRILAEQARLRFPRSKIVPIVVTNYQVSESDKAVLAKEGVEIIAIPLPLDLDTLVSKFVHTVEARKEEPPARST